MAKHYAARKPGTKAVRLDLTEAEHTAFRLLAAQAGVPMSEYARRIVADHIAAKGAKGTKKIPKKNPK
jgi:hypothetical protein